MSRGNYKGDVGFVFELQSWVEVLLVPRLNLSTTDLTLKRKRTTSCPEPALFDVDKGFHIVQGLHFDNGLLHKKYDFHSVSPTADIPFRLFSLFQLSDHPLVILYVFPKPEEWIFEEGNPVVICSSGESGIVT